MKIIPRKKLIEILSIILVLISLTNIFISTPLQAVSYKFQAIFLVLSFLFTIIYVMNVILENFVFDKTILFFILLMFSLPFYSAIRANLEFGQPIMIGILASRQWLILGGCLWVYYALKNNKISMDSVKDAFIILAWGTFIFFTFLYLTIDPTQIDLDENVQIRVDQERGLRFQFQYFFVTFGAIYYFVRYSIEKKKIDLVAFLCFLIFFFLVVKSRTAIILLLFTLLLFYYFYFNIAQFMKKILTAVLFSLLSIFMLQLLMPEYFDTMLNLFIEMFTVLFSGQESNDTSSNIRLATTTTIFEYFDKNPYSLWFGVGKMSTQWNDGLHAFFSQYFYPSDVGIIGGTFMYGLVGMFFLLIVSSLIFIREIRRTKEKEDIFIITIKYMAIMYLIRLPQGGLYFIVDGWIILLFILYTYNYISRNKINEKGNC